MALPTEPRREDAQAPGAPGRRRHVPPLRGRPAGPRRRARDWRSDPELIRAPRPAASGRRARAVSPRRAPSDDCPARRACSPLVARPARSGGPGWAARPASPGGWPASAWVVSQAWPGGGPASAWVVSQAWPGRPPASAWAGSRVSPAGPPGARTARPGALAWTARPGRRRREGRPLRERGAARAPRRAGSARSLSAVRRAWGLRPPCSRSRPVGRGPARRRRVVLTSRR
jgi:hypothetical protein